MCDVVEDRPIVGAQENVGAALQEVDDERENAENDVNAGVVDENGGTPVNHFGRIIYRYILGRLNISRKIINQISRSYQANSTTQR